jgi:outer membrane protein OmpA-like peptidoglycan-associated protein
MQEKLTPYQFNKIIYKETFNKELIIIMISSLLIMLNVNQLYSQENLIVNNLGYIDCVGNKGYSGHFERKCHANFDSSQYPWCDFSYINYVGLCNENNLRKFAFEFSNNSQKSIIEHIQGEFCHRLILKNEYTFKFNLHANDLNNLDNINIYINLSDSILSMINLSELSKSQLPIEFNNSIKNTKDITFSKNVISNGTEKFFQIWIIPKRNNLNKHLQVFNLELTSQVDTKCFNISNPNNVENINKSDSFSEIRLNYYFENNKYNLKQIDIDCIKAFINNIDSNKFEVISIDISGFTDSIGTFEYNKHLSTLRASETLKILKNIGIRCNNINLSGNGYNFPYRSELYLNRRIEIEFKVRIK